MTLRLIAASIKGKFSEALAEKYPVVAKAATGAINDAADTLKQEARAEIARGGFSKRWQNTLRVDVYPRGGKESVNPAIWMWHKIPYAGVFERGATIQGKPLLWLPTKHAPKRVGGKKVTPKRYSQIVAPLRSVKGTKVPMLVANVTARRGKKKGMTQSLPIFVGVPTVTIGKKFSVLDVGKRVAAQLPALYAANFRPD